MSAHRFFLTSPLPAGDHVRVPLSSDDLHHAVSVLRVGAGEHIEVVEPNAGVWLLEVEVAAKDGLSARRCHRLATIERVPVTLFQGVAKGDKMDDIVRQSVELGVAQVIPVLTARSVVRLDQRKSAAKGERWRRVAKSAAEQSHHSYVPRVFDPINLDEADALLPEFDAVFVLWEEATEPMLVEVLGRVSSTSHIAVIVGPEGGFAPEEIERLTEKGVLPVTLGPSILRTETAAVTAVALAIHCRSRTEASA